MDHLQIFACIFLIIFTLVASIDGFYFHLYKYKLYTRKESIYEHFLHTLNSFFFPFTIVLLFIFNVSGILLWLSIILTLITLVIEFVDVFEEKKSRENIGGLSSLEYAMHFSMSGLRATYTTIILAGKPLAAWTLSKGNLSLVHYPLPLAIIGTSVAVLGVPVFILHYYLWRNFEKNR